MNRISRHLRSSLNLGATVFMAVSLCPGAPEDPPPAAITNVTVISMQGEEALPGQTVLTAGGRILSIGPSADVAIPEDAYRIDGEGRFLIPGLSDMHAHVRHARGHRPEDYLKEGVTVVRNMQGEASHLEFREQVRSGEVPGPIFYTAGPAIAGNPRIDKRHVIPEGPEEAKALVREHQRAGYDYIKVYSLLTAETYAAILEESARLGIPVVGHAPDSVRASGAVAAGQSSLEHFYGYFWDLEADDSEISGRWDPRRLFHAVTIDESKLDAVVEQTVAAGVWNCPTLWRKNNYLTSPLAREAWETPSLRELGERNRLLLLKALHDAGAGLLTGTDAEANLIHDELALFVKAGLTPFEALHASTVGAARYLGRLEDFGTVETGKQANLVLLEDNPLEDITATRSIVGVMMRGFWMPR